MPLKHNNYYINFKDGSKMFYVMGIQFSYNFIPIVTEHAKINLFPCEDPFLKCYLMSHVSVKIRILLSFIVK